MKKITILLIALMIATGCSAAKATDKKTATPKATSEQKVVERAAEVSDLKSNEQKGRVTLSWKLENTDGVEKIIIAKKGNDNKIKRMPLSPDVREYTVDLEPLEKTTFFIKLQYKNGTVTPGAKIITTAKLGTAIFKEKEYIDTTSDTVKLLFRTNPEAKVEVLMGDSEDNLKIVKSEEKYNFRSGMKISGLVPGNTYFYKIISEKDGEKVETKTISFIKQKNDLYAEKAEWARKAVFYEVFVRSFYDTDGNGIGDFKGIGEKSAYLKDLGVDALWLMPSLKSNTYHGYDVVDYYNVEDDYGTMDDFENMLKKSHENGIKIIIDFVINHSSDDNLWFVEASKGAENPYRDYYVWSDPFENRDEPGPWGQNVWYENGGQYYYADFTAGMPDLNYRNPAVREDIKKAAKFWLDKGVDGFRLDASRHIDDRDVEVTLSWWKEFNAYVKSINKDAFLVGEAWNEDPAAVAPYMAVLDSSFNFGFSGFMPEQIRKNKIDTLEMLSKTREAYAKEAKNFIDCTFIRNHDMDRTASEFREVAKQKDAFAMLLTLPGTPFLYYGEELGQKGMSPDEHRREPMDWYKEMQGPGMTTWEKPYYNRANDGISLEDVQNDPDSLYNFIKKIIKIRKENDFIFTDTPVKIENGEIYGYSYFASYGKLEVIYNLSKENKNYTINREGFSKATNCYNDSELDGTLVLAPNDILIIKYIK